MRRQRSAKRLGTRHDLNYFKQWTPWKRARFSLAVALPLVAVVWILVLGVHGDAHPASSGPLSRGHAFFANDCKACHSSYVKGVRVSVFRQHTSDEACLTCHAAPVHHANQVGTPTCGSCHVEHKGAARLAEVAVPQCTQCHENLRTADGRLTVASRIADFNSDHPEFAALRAKESDPGTIAFNHAVHLKPIEGPGKKQVQLDCGDCHRTGADQNAPWRFAAASFTPPASTGDRAYMVPPTYAGTCAACHDLRFDPNVAVGAPHDKPEVVLAYLEKVYSSGPHPAAHTVPARLIPAMAHRDAHSPNEHIKIAARLLWGKTCKECHDVDSAPGAALPTIAPSQITRVWLPKSKFSHAPHRSFSCESCHERVTDSVQTAEVLVPSISTCQTCHNGDPQNGARSDNRCSECHEYHDWKQQPAFKGRYNIQELKRARSN